MKKVMLLGDSIRIAYQDFVVQELGDEYEVWHPEENGRFAKYTLNELERWFQACPAPDIIHWNNGLWDSAIVCKEDGMFTTVEEYLHDLFRIVRELKKHTPNVIFATTTPVKPNSANQKLEYVQALNEAAVPFLKEHGVVIDDLYAVASQNLEAYIGPDCIHPTELGARTFAKAVAASIRGICH